MTRLKATTSVLDAVMALSKEDDGKNHSARAASVLTQLIKRDQIPALFVLDKIKLYGEKIWQVYSEDCGHDIDMFLLGISNVYLEVLEERMKHAREARQGNIGHLGS